MDKIEAEAKALYEDFRAAAAVRMPPWPPPLQAERDPWLAAARGSLRRHCADVGGPTDPDPPK